MGERFAACVGLMAMVSVSACAAKTPPPQPASAARAANAGAVAVAAAIPSGPPVALIPAAAARGYLLGSVSIGSVDRLFENAARLVGQAVPLPMDAKGLRDMLLTQAGLPTDVAASLDFASPTGAAVVAIGEKGESGTVIAVPAKGPVEAQRVIDALGKPIMVRGSVVLVRSPNSGSGWLYRSGNIVVLSDELEALSRGAMLALEARRAGPDDLTATFFPDAIAHAHGTDVKTAIAHALKAAREQRKGATGPAMDDRSLEPVGELAGLVGDATRAELGLTADPARGLVLRSRLVAKPGTQLEAVAREVRPFELDPAVAGDKLSRFMVFSTSLGPFWHGTFAKYRERLAADKGKGAAAALAYYDATLAALAGQTSGAMWLLKDEPHLAGAFTSPLKDAASAATVSAAMAKLDGPALSAFIRAQVGDVQPFDVSAKKETVGKLKTIHYRIKLKNTGTEKEAVRKFFGGEMDVYGAVAGTRALVTLGHAAKARLVAISSGKAVEAEKAGSLADATAAAKGRDGFYYLDLAPLLAMVGRFSNEPRMAMLARNGGSPIPVVVTAGGDGAGKQWSSDLTVTVAAFSSIGALVAGSMGAPAK